MSVDLRHLDEIAFHCLTAHRLASATGELAHVVDALELALQLLGSEFAVSDRSATADDAAEPAARLLPGGRLGTV